MGQTLPTKRIWYGYPYAIPSDVLSNEPTHDEDPSSLRAEASRDGTSYLRLLKAFHDGTYLARVAAHPTFFPRPRATPSCSPLSSSPRLAPGIVLCRRPDDTPSLRSERTAAHRPGAGE